jgi:hypothetical protein
MFPILQYVQSVSMTVIVESKRLVENSVISNANLPVKIDFDNETCSSNPKSRRLSSANLSV